MACSCNGRCTRCKKNGGIIQKKQLGGLLRGPSHAQGGIPAIVGGTTPVELEGGEYVIRKSSVDKYGEGTIAKINQGLVDPNKLQKLRRGGRVRNGRSFAHGGRAGVGNNETLTPGSNCAGECLYSATGGMFNFGRPCPPDCQCPGIVDGAVLIRGCRSGGGKGMVRRTGGKIKRNRTASSTKMVRGGKIQHRKLKKGGVTKHKKSRKYKTGGVISRGLGTNGMAMNFKRGGKIKKGRK